MSESHSQTVHLNELGQKSRNQKGIKHHRRGWRNEKVSLFLKKNLRQNSKTLGSVTILLSYILYSYLLGVLISLTEGKKELLASSHPSPF